MFSISNLNDVHDNHMNEKRLIYETLEISRSSLEALSKSKPIIDEEFKFYQEIKSFTTDIIDCLNEKVKKKF